MIPLHDLSAVAGISRAICGLEISVIWGPSHICLIDATAPDHLRYRYYIEVASQSPSDNMISPRWSKQLDIRAFLIFQRIQRMYKTFVVLAALISGLAVAALTLNEYHPPSSDLIFASEGFLCSSAITAIISAVLAIMLLFQFEGSQRATRRDLAVAWAPLVLLDLSVVEFLVGMVCWYCSKNARWRGALVTAQLVGLLGLCAGLSTWMWFYMSQKGNLGVEESQSGDMQKRVADE